MCVELSSNNSNCTVAVACAACRLCAQRRTQRTGTHSLSQTLVQPDARQRSGKQESCISKPSVDAACCSLQAQEPTQKPWPVLRAHLTRLQAAGMAGKRAWPFGEAEAQASRCGTLTFCPSCLTHLLTLSLCRLAACADLLQAYVLPRLRLRDAQALRHTCCALRQMAAAADSELQQLATVRAFHTELLHLKAPPDDALHAGVHARRAPGQPGRNTPAAAGRPCRCPRPHSTHARPTKACKLLLQDDDLQMEGTILSGQASQMFSRGDYALVCCDSLTGGVARR